MQKNDVLNNVLVVMVRSLLQYAAEAWPWTSRRAESARTAIEQLIAEQRARIRKLSDLLDGRRWPIDFGAFPDYTNLHFLSLDFVVPHLQANQRLVVGEIEAAIAQCVGDTEATVLLGEILQGERAARAKLDELARAQPAGSAA